MKKLKKIKEITANFESGIFQFKSTDNLSNLIKKNKVPNKPGVYIIYAKTKADKKIIIYIGKSGTMDNNGKFKNQMLSKRLKATQNNMSREKFFKSLIVNNKYKSLIVKWFVTFDNKNSILPAKLESDLIQIYYDIEKKLPLLNKEI